MADTFVVELNQNNSSWSRPGEFECLLAEPITINEGDQLSFRMASLDSNITDQDTILITNDETLTATFSYYEVNYDGTDKISVGDNGGQPVAADFKYYAAYNDITTVTVTGIEVDIVGYEQGDPNPSAGDPIPGSYIIGNNGPGSQVDPIVNFSAFFTYIDPSGVVRYPEFVGNNTTYENDPGFGPLYYAASGSGTVTLQVTPFTMRSGTLQFANVKGYWPGRRNGAGNISFNFGSTVPRAGGKEAENDTDYPFEMSDFKLGTVTYALQTASTGDVLNIQTVNVTLKAGRYDPQSLAVEITQLFSAAAGIKPAGGLLQDQVYVPNNPFLIRTDDPQNSNMFFNQVPQTRVQGGIVFEDGKTYKYYNPAAPAVIPPYFVGATEFSLEYDVGGGQVFQLSYCHMPMTDPARPGEQDIALYTTGTPGNGLTYNAVTSASGIAFHDLQPASFWQGKLGLREKLIVPLLKDINGLQYYTEPSLIRSITYGFQGLGSFLLPPTGSGNPVTYPDFRKMTPLVPTPNPIYLNVTGQSRAIIGDTITVNTAGGYFLIECLNAFRSSGGYIDSTENRRYISAVVSTQMDNNNTITGYSDSDTAGYIHRGASYLISSVVVRILNPFTKLPVATLGPNNCIWLQIQKQIQEQTQTVVHKSEKIKPVIKKREPKPTPTEAKAGETTQPAKIKLKLTPKSATKFPETSKMSVKQLETRIAELATAEAKLGDRATPSMKQQFAEYKQMYEQDIVKAKTAPIKLTIRPKTKEQVRAEKLRAEGYKGPITAAGYPNIGAMREKLGLPPIGKMQPEPGAVAQKREAFYSKIPETVAERRADVPPELK